MTEYTSIEIDSIIVDRPNRQRKELKDLDQLARSIRENGLINPPTVTPDLILIAGERRLTACRDVLGWSHITVGIREEEPTISQRKVELAENVERLELDWKDKCFAIKEFFDLSREEEPKITTEAISANLNLTSSMVKRSYDLAVELDKGTALICQAAQFSVAFGILERMKERQAQADKDRLRSMIAGVPVADVSADPLDDILNPKADVKTSQPSEIDNLFSDEPAPDTRAIPFRCSDFNRFAESYQGTRFNFLHCDFPYGVNADKHNLGAAKSFGGYADSADVYWQLIASLNTNVERLVTEDAHMMFWYSMDYHAETVAALTEGGWKVNPFPLVWFKSDNSGILPDPKRGPRRNYETALLCTRGDRKIIQAVSNVCPHPNTKSLHMSEKPIGMLRHFFRMFVDSTTTILDPTMGSGNAIVLAESLGANYRRGLERDKEIYNNAKQDYLNGKYDLGE